MSKLEEMWVALTAYQPQADADGHGATWATMCREKTADAAARAADAAAANAAGDAAAAAARAAALDAAAAAAARAAAARAAADCAAAANGWAQKAIDKIKEKT